MATSSFTPLERPQAVPRATAAGNLMGALESTAFSLPVGLGCTTLVFAHVGVELLPAGLFALLLSMIWVHASTAGDQRPVLYGARFFEATTVAAMIEQVVGQLPAWGLQNSTGVRVAFLCLIGAAGGIVVGLLYLLRADRFTRLIPAPVFVGFSNSIALALVISQSRTLWNLLRTAPAVAPVILIGAAVLCITTGARLLRPRWPGASIALGTGLLLGLLSWRLGHPTPTIGTFGWQPELPVALADFRALGAANVRTWQLAGAIATDGAILGTMMFINTTMTAEFMTQADGLRRTRRAAALLPAAGLALSGLVGSAPLSGSITASVIASRKTVVAGPLLLWCALIVAGVYLTGVVGLIPLTAICGALLGEAWFMVDRSSLRLLWNWLLRRPMSANGREDLMLISMVTATAVLLNMVAAVFVGLLLGLLLFAVRNARRPVRHVWTGLQVNSNCARSPRELQVLAEHGASICVLELQGDLFFGAIDSLERSLEAAMTGAASLVLDWSRVRHADSSVIRAIAQFERRARARGVAPIHAGIGAQGDELASLLRDQLPNANRAGDLDRALERAENEVLRTHAEHAGAHTTGLIETAPVFGGMTDEERNRLQEAMTSRLFRAGELIMRAGEPGDQLMLVLHGSASVVVAGDDGEEFRLAGVRRGATIGDIAFLDQSPRSASVVAEEDTTVAVLSRESYNELSGTHPRLVQCLLSNLALGLAQRLRHSNRLALARQRAR